MDRLPFPDYSVDDRSRALALLSSITLKWLEKRHKRDGDLIVSPAHNVPGSTIPRPWCPGWRFHVEVCFADSLDAQRTPIVVKKSSGKDARGKTTELFWTQGSRFDFHPGYMLYDTHMVRAAGVEWGGALRHINMAVQIIEASPAESAYYTIYRSWKFDQRPPRKDINDLISSLRECDEDGIFIQSGSGDNKKWDLRRLVARDPGRIRARIFRPNTDRTALMEVSILDTTQDSFVKMLISGLED